MTRLITGLSIVALLMTIVLWYGLSFRFEMPSLDPPAPTPDTRPGPPRRASHASWGGSGVAVPGRRSARRLQLLDVRRSGDDTTQLVAVPMQQSLDGRDMIAVVLCGRDGSQTLAVYEIEPAGQLHVVSARAIEHDNLLASYNLSANDQNALSPRDMAVKARSDDDEAANRGDEVQWLRVRACAEDGARVACEIRYVAVPAGADLQSLMRQLQPRMMRVVGSTDRDGDINVYAERGMDALLFASVGKLGGWRLVPIPDTGWQADIAIELRPSMTVSIADVDETWSLRSVSGHVVEARLDRRSFVVPDWLPRTRYIATRAGDDGMNEAVWIGPDAPAEVTLAPAVRDMTLQLELTVDGKPLRDARVRQVLGNRALDWIDNGTARHALRTRQLDVAGWRVELSDDEWAAALAGQQVTVSRALQTGTVIGTTPDDARFNRDRVTLQRCTPIDRVPDAIDAMQCSRPIVIATAADHTWSASLPQGEYSVWLEPRTLAGRFVVRADEVTNCDPVPAPAARLLLDLDDAFEFGTADPLALELSLTDESGIQLLAAGQVRDGLRRLDVGAVPAGDHTLNLWMPGAARTSSLVSLRPGVASSIAVAGSRGYPLALQIIDANRNPQPGARVHVLDRNGRITTPLGTALEREHGFVLNVADEHGMLVLHDMPVSICTVRASTADNSMHGEKAFAVGPHTTDVRQLVVGE
ncbi:MAG: hypothetical protein AB7K09_01890 [Planctomycetota bacterium]